MQIYHSEKTYFVKVMSNWKSKMEWVLNFLIVVCAPHISYNYLKIVFLPFFVWKKSTWFQIIDM